MQILSCSGCFTLTVNKHLTFSLLSSNKIIMSIGPWRVSGALWEKRERNHGDWCPTLRSCMMSMLPGRTGYFCLVSNIDNQSEKRLKITTDLIHTWSLRIQPQNNIVQAQPQWHKPSGQWEGQESSDDAFENDSFPASATDSPCRFPALAFILTSPHWTGLPHHP